MTIVRWFFLINVTFSPKNNRRRSGGKRFGLLTMLDLKSCLLGVVYILKGLWCHSFHTQKIRYRPETSWLTDVDFSVFCNR